MDALPNLDGVIVADDDAVVRSVLRSKLRAIDQTVWLASNGLEAVELASRMRPRLILLDLGMPQLNGLLACQRIRQMPHNAKTPIVILTSILEKNAQTASARIGATAFLTKPFRSGELLQVLSCYLTGSDFSRDVTKRKADRVTEIARNRAPVDW